MDGGCSSPMGVPVGVHEHRILVQAVLFLDYKIRRNGHRLAVAAYNSQTQQRNGRETRAYMRALQDIPFRDYSTLL